ncbi:MAG: hypothetical protein WCJ64_13470 [Rhodospirillaceae bacterium]
MTNAEENLGKLLAVWPPYAQLLHARSGRLDEEREGQRPQALASVDHRFREQ